MATNPGRTKSWLLTSALVAGSVIGGAGIAHAASNDSSSSSSTSDTAATAQAPQQGQDPSTMTNGPGETLLTGTEADQVTAAAKAAIPDGTIIRVETDNEGAAYEAHVKKTDGTVVTLKFDSSYNLTDTIDGFGKAPQGQAPSSTSSSGTASSGASA
jgi:hypothetical protein